MGSSNSRPDPPSVEFEVIRENYDYLVGMIKQSPESVGDKLYARGFLSDESRDRIREDISKLNKARLIIDVVVDRTKVDRRYLYQFLEVLEAEGLWLRDTIVKLKSDLLMKCRLGILVVGRTGSGKSTLVKNLLGIEVKDKNPLEPVTEDVEIYEGVIENVPVRLYDVPGIDDHLFGEKACFFMLSEVIENNEIHAVIFCLRISDCRLTQDFIQAMKSYVLIGLDWGKTVFALTCAENVIEDQAIRRSQESTDTDIATYFNGRVESSREIIIRALTREAGVKHTAMKFCPTTNDPECVLPNGHRWLSLLWHCILELSPFHLMLKENANQ